MYQFDPNKVDIHKQIELETTQASSRLDVQNILARRGPLKGLDDLTSNDLKSFQNPKLYDTFQRAMLFNESPYHSFLKNDAQEAGQSVRDYVKSNPKAIFMEHREVDAIVDVLKETNLLDRKLGRPATDKEINEYAKGEFFLDVMEGINPKNPGPETSSVNDFLKDSFAREQKASKELSRLSQENLLYDKNSVDYINNQNKVNVDVSKEDLPQEPPKVDVSKVDITKNEAPKVETIKTEPVQNEPKTFGEKFKKATKNFIEKVSDIVNNINTQKLKTNMAHMFNKLADKIVPDEPTPSISINKNAMEKQPEEPAKTNSFKFK